MGLRRTTPSLTRGEILKGLRKSNLTESLGNNPRHSLRALNVKKAPLNVVILAAGKGTRMHSGLPKVLHAIGGKPMLGHVLERATALRADRTIVVYGYGGKAIPSAFGNA